MFFHRDQDYDIPSPYREYRVSWRWLRPKYSAVVFATIRWFFLIVRDPRGVRLHDLLSILVQNSRVRFPADISRALDSFRPEVIYAWAGDSLWTEVLATAARHCHSPYVIHFMDNHAGHLPVSAIERTLQPLFKYRLAHAIKGAATIFTISDSMGLSYKAKFCKGYEVFRGMIDTKIWPPYSPRETGRPFTLAFTGSVEYSQMLGLVDIATAVDRLLATGLSIRLVLYLTEQYEIKWATEFAKYNCIVVRRHPAFDQLADALASADLLVLAYGFDDRTINYYRYSFATKIVPYMLSGTSILVYGPSEIEPVEYAFRGGWATVITEKNTDILAGRIADLVAGKEERKRLAAAAYIAAVGQHDLDANAHRFRKSLHALAKYK